MNWLLLSFVFALALSLDCFALSVTDGLVYPDMGRKKSFFAAGTFGLFQGLFPLVGFLLGLAFSQWIDAYDHWVGFVLLAAIGLKMIIESSIEIAKKRKGEIKENERKTLTYPMILVQGVADSIDALAIGITVRTNIQATADYQIYVCFAVIAVVSFLVSLAGLYGGKFFNRIFRGKVEVTEIIGGTVLVLLGLFILLEGLGYMG